MRIWSMQMYLFLLDRMEFVLGRIDGDGKINFILTSYIIFLLKPLLKSCEQISMFLQGYSMTKSAMSTEISHEGLG